MVSTDEKWRVSRVELRELLNKYERAVEEDAFNLLRPTKSELEMIGEEQVNRRRECVRKARDANRKFVEAVVDDLPDLCAAGPQTPNRPVMAFKTLGANIPTLPTSSYGSLSSMFLHVFRDWSATAEHVSTTQYRPVVEEVKRLVKQGGDVLVPGAALARLALSIANEGYQVEANEASRLFLTFADYMVNRPTAEGSQVHPLAHVFSENYCLNDQYQDVLVPSPRPEKVLSPSAGESAGASCTMIPGDFAKLYAHGCPGHRTFGAVVTCFFLDTGSDVCETIRIIDGLLKPGGVWINIGPLNWRKDTRAKLSWNEIVTIWERLGYNFIRQDRVDCDYHLPRGSKMYTESYTCAFSSARKGGADEQTQPSGAASAS